MYTPHFEVILRYVDQLGAAVLLSLAITFASLFFGAILGLLMAFARVFGGSWLRWLAAAYVEVFRNIPLLLIIVFIYFGLPLVGIRFLENVPSVILAMSLYAGSYLTEIFRAGIVSVEAGYVEAGKSIGLTGRGVARHVLIPLAFTQALPALGNMAISLFKDSSLASATAVREITFVGRLINTDTWRVIEAWTVVGGFYLGISYLFAFLLRQVEKRYIRWR